MLRDIFLEAKRLPQVACAAVIPRTGWQDWPAWERILEAHPLAVHIRPPPNVLIYEATPLLTAASRRGQWEGVAALVGKRIGGWR